MVALTSLARTGDSTTSIPKSSVRPCERLTQSSHNFYKLHRAGRLCDGRILEALPGISVAPETQLGLSEPGTPDDQRLGQSSREGNVSEVCPAGFQKDAIRFHCLLSMEL